jgi:nucleoid-associated protein YgaU
MTVRRTICLVTACLAVCAVLVLPACGDRDGAPLPAETDEPFYVQGKTLVRQGRHPEALTSFLKVIERRGERGAAESHLEAGSIYLYYTKDPVEAYHHFRRYLALQPNSKEAAGVRGKVEEAKREFARTLPARPLEDQSLRMQADDAFAKLQREVEELRAQNATLRGGSSIPVSRSAPMISLPDEVQPRQPAPPVSTVVDPASIAVAPQTRATSAAGNALQVPVNAQPAAQRPATATTRPTNPTARTHTVAPKETLYGISVKYYGNGRQVDAIYQANRDQMRSREDVRPGMTLKLPGGDGATAPRR